MKKYITKPALNHLSSSPLLGLVHCLIGWPVFMCRLRETAAAHVVSTLYYHLFNRTDGSAAENVHSVTIHQGRNQTPPICSPQNRVNSQVHPALCWQLLTCPRAPPSSRLLSAPAWFHVAFYTSVKTKILTILTGSYQRESVPAVSSAELNN